jgi:hypothetical protein
VTPLAVKALEIAESKLGVKEHPPGSNRGPEVDEFLRSVGLDPERKAYPWCAAFVSWCVEQAGHEIFLIPIFRRSASCQRLVELNEHLHMPSPQAGCVFVHLNPDHTGHTGFVTSVRADGSFDDISGNSDASGSRTGGMVCRNHRLATYASYFLRIA